MFKAQNSPVLDRIFLYCLHLNSKRLFDIFVDTYDDRFFEQLDGVANALDNIDASK